MQAHEYLEKRQAAGLTQAEVARRIRKSRAQVIRVETGQSGASLEYEALFLSALSDDWEERRTAVLAAVPTLQTAKALADSAGQLQAAVSQLRGLHQALTTVLRASSRMVEQSEALTAGVPAFNTWEFDPDMSSAEDVALVSSFICAIIIELVEVHRFGKLNDERLDGYLEEWMQRVSREVKKRRNRELL